MDAFAIYRLPHSSQCTLVGQSGVPLSLPSLRGLGVESGFVIAPFTISDDSLVVLLRPDVVRQCSPAEVEKMDGLPFYLDSGDMPFQSASREAYHDDFARFHRTFSEMGLQKLVLARSADIAHGGTHPALLFALACRDYPEAFVTLFSIPQYGTWLVATPEVLLASEGGKWHTMALAGTMEFAERLPSWNEKNVREQAYVSQYIKSCLEGYSNDVDLKGPYTTRSGHLVHLRTDFSFTLTDDVRLGEVLDTLHPTPAVCGVPKQDALQFIVDNESTDRSIYSGFSGPLNLAGNTALFVSLRCMRILDDRYRLYAGGGILPESDEALEWDETAAKMQAMLSLIN